jgi:hypothetical protein
MSRSLLIRSASSGVVERAFGGLQLEPSRGREVPQQVRQAPLVDRIAAWNRLTSRPRRFPPGIDPPEGILQASLRLEGR